MHVLEVIVFLLSVQIADVYSGQSFKAFLVSPVEDRQFSTGLVGFLGHGWRWHCFGYPIENMGNYEVEARNFEISKFET